MSSLNKATMKNSLILLIVLVIVILAVVFLASPNCRNGVASIFKKPARKDAAPKARRDRDNAQSTVDSQTLLKQQQEAASRALAQQKEAVRRDIPVSGQLDNNPERNAASDLLQRQKELNRRGIPVANELDRNATRQPATESLEALRENARRRLPVSSEKADFLAKRRQAQKQVAPVQVARPEQVTEPARVQPQSFKVLNGSIEDMFNTRVDVQKEFGISEEQLNVMASDYKKRHLETPKPEVLRNRFIRKSEMERSEQVLRSSFVNAAALNARINVEEFTVNALRKNIMASETSKDAPVKGKLNAFRPRTE